MIVMECSLAIAHHYISHREGVNQVRIPGSETFGMDD